MVVNGIALKTKSGFADHYYNDTSGTAFTGSLRWHILGSSVVDSFSFVNPNLPPQFSLAAQLPDSTSLSGGLRIRLRGTSGCDLIRLVLISGQAVNKLIAGSDSVVTVSPAELQNLSTSATAYLSVELYKDNYRQVNGKTVNFRSGSAYTNSAFKIKQ